MSCEPSVMFWSNAFVRSASPATWELTPSPRCSSAGPVPSRGVLTVLIEKWSSAARPAASCLRTWMSTTTRAPIHCHCGRLTWNWCWPLQALLDGGGEARQERRLLRGGPLERGEERGAARARRRDPRDHAGEPRVARDEAAALRLDAVLEHDRALDRDRQRVGARRVGRAEAADPRRRLDRLRAADRTGVERVGGGEVLRGDAGRRGDGGDRLRRRAPGTGDDRVERRRGRGGGRRRLAPQHAAGGRQPAVAHRAGDRGVAGRLLEREHRAERGAAAGREGGRSRGSGLRGLRLLDGGRLGALGLGAHRTRLVGRVRPVNATGGQPFGQRYRIPWAGRERPDAPATGACGRTGRARNRIAWADRTRPLPDRVGGPDAPATGSRGRTGRAR